MTTPPSLRVPYMGLLIQINAAQLAGFHHFAAALLAEYRRLVGSS